MPAKPGEESHHWQGEAGRLNLSLGGGRAGSFDVYHQQKGVVNRGSGRHRGLCWGGNVLGSKWPEIRGGRSSERGPPPSGSFPTCRNSTGRSFVPCSGKGQTYFTPRAPVMEKWRGSACLSSISSGERRPRPYRKPMPQSLYFYGRQSDIRISECSEGFP